MPYSNLEQLAPIINELKKIRPKSILDVGCGLGVYGYMIRVYLELYGDDENFMKKLNGKQPWSIKMHGIEGYKGYLKYIPDWVYDKVVNDSAMKILKKIKDKQYDIALALAIVEHFDKNDGLALLNELKRVGKKVIVSVPIEWHEQTVPENDLETHRSHWTDTDFISAGFNRFIEHPFVWIPVYEENSEETINQSINTEYNQKKKNKFNIFRLFSK